MFTTSSMELLSMVVFRDKMEDVISRLVELGIFQPVDICKVENNLTNLSPLQIENESVEWQVIETNLRDIAIKLNLHFSPSGKIEPLPAEEIKNTLKALDGEVSGLVSERAEVAGELKTTETMFSQIKDYFIFPLKRNSFYSFLQVNLGKIYEKNMEVLERSLKEIPHLIYPFNTQDKHITLLLIGLKRNKPILDKVLHDVAWQEVEFPKETEELSSEAEKRLKGKIAQHKARITDLDRKIQSIARDSADKLSKIYSLVALKKSFIEAKKYSYATEKTVVISGWVLREEKDRFVAEIKKISGVSYMERHKAEELAIAKEDIPVYLKHNAVFKPFELLINSYGIPRYGTVDPTIFVAISFLFMFGAMFGDLGQGLILFFLGFLLKKSKKEKVKQVATLIVYCGASSTIFGIFYGSFFGLEGVIPAFWVNPMKNILEVFKVSIFFGVTVITIGIIFNVINALKDKDYMSALFDKSGLITGIVYWVAIAFVSRLFVSKATIPSFYIILILCGLTLIFLKPFIGMIVKTKKQKEGLLISFMESIVDVIEVVMGYLANTVSFIRIAAFSLAHAGLFLAIFELSRMVKGFGGEPLSLVVMILGNIFIILLEGLVVSIQSLRLNYYEFFSKFFLTGKERYKPLTMKYE